MLKSLLVFPTNLGDLYPGVFSGVERSIEGPKSLSPKDLKTESSKSLEPLEFAWLGKLSLREGISPCGIPLTQFKFTS